jgi:hypothetical protein
MIRSAYLRVSQGLRIRTRSLQVGPVKDSGVFTRNDLPVFISFGCVLTVTGGASLGRQQRSPIDGGVTP